jgi:hypothetical protein
MTRIELIDGDKTNDEIEFRLELLADEERHEIGCGAEEIHQERAALLSQLAKSTA